MSEQSIGDLVNRLQAEQATGLAQTRKSLGKYYINESTSVDPRSAYEMLRDGRAASVHVPNAGAGSYREFFTSLGFSEIRVLQQSSSAGDWSFGVKDGPTGMWYPACQVNRHPRHGFEYSVDCRVGFNSVEEICDYHEL